MLEGATRARAVRVVSLAAVGRDHDAVGQLGNNPSAGRDARDRFVNRVTSSLVVRAGLRAARHFVEFLNVD